MTFSCDVLHYSQQQEGTWAVMQWALPGGLRAECQHLLRRGLPGRLAVLQWAHRMTESLWVNGHAVRQQAEMPGLCHLTGLSSAALGLLSCRAPHCVEQRHTVPSGRHCPHIYRRTCSSRVLTT